MVRRNLWGPLSVLIAGLVVIATMLVAPYNHSGAMPQSQSYPGNTTPANTTYPGNTTSTATTTSAPVTATSSGATPRASTPTTASPTTNGSTVRATVSTTSPATFTATTPDTGGGFAAVPTSEIETPQPTEETLGPTPAPPAGETLNCIPGETIELSGEGPPRAPFLLYFNDRAIGGGSVDRSGHFTVPLTVGSERAGVYEVVVRIRGSSEVLLERTCQVPAITPTLLPTRLPSLGR